MSSGQREYNARTKIVSDLVDVKNGAALLIEENKRLRETVEIVNCIASKASLTDEEKLIDIRNLTSPKSDNGESQ